MSLCLRCVLCLCVCSVEVDIAAKMEDLEKAAKDNATKVRLSLRQPGSFRPTSLCRAGCLPRRSESHSCFVRLCLQSKHWENKLRDMVNKIRKAAKLQEAQEAKIAAENKQLAESKAAAQAAAAAAAAGAPAAESKGDSKAETKV